MSLWHPLDRLIGIVLAGIIAAVSYRFRLLTGGGAFSAFFMGSVVFALGRVGFSIPMLVFFASSSLLSKLGYERKSKLVSHIAKTSQRDSMQVLANGLVPTLLLISCYFSQNDIFSFLYVAALACATADTWATELGCFRANNRGQSLASGKLQRVCLVGSRWSERLRRWQARRFLGWLVCRR